MVRIYKEPVDLPDGRHLDWRLLSRIEQELLARRDRWKAQWKGVSHYGVTVSRRRPAQ